MSDIVEHTKSTLSGLKEGLTGGIEQAFKGTETPDAPEKTEEEERLEAEAAEAAYQENLKTEREKQSRKRGASGRRTLTYTPTTGQSVGIKETKLGGGV